MNTKNTKQQLVVSVDDYSEFNIIIASLLLKYKIEAIFFIEMIPHKEDATYDQAVEQIKKFAGMGFEIGGHTMNHPRDIKQLNRSQLETEIIQNKQLIEAVIDKDIDSFAYPRGRYSPRVKEMVRQAGYKYARTTRLGDYDDDLEMRADIHIYPRQEYKGKDWLEVAKKIWDKGDNMHVFMHAWEVESMNQWEKVVNFFEYVTK